MQIIPKGAMSKGGGGGGLAGGGVVHISLFKAYW